MQKLLSLLFITTSLFSMKLEIVNHTQNVNKIRIESSSTFVPNQLGSLELYHGKKGFSIHKDGEKHKVKKYFTDKIVRDIDKKQLKSFLEHGYLAVNQMDDGEYSLKAKQRLHGGGPVTGWMAYWITKSVCYGTAAAAVGGLAVTGTGALIGGATALGSGAVIGSVTTGGATSIVAITGISTVGSVTTVTIGTAGATGTVSSIAAGLASAGTLVNTALATVGMGGAIAPTTAIAGGILNAGLAGEATLATASLISSVGSVGSAIAVVESASLGVGAFFTAIPFLP